jgi:hypothetical protein
MNRSSTGMQQGYEVAGYSCVQRIKTGSSWGFISWLLDYILLAEKLKP